MIFGMIFLSLSIAAYIAGIAWCCWDIKNEERWCKSLSGVQCKKCRYLLKDKEGYNWCPNKTDDPDIDLIRDCEWYAVKTNADRIRAMTNEELAVFLGNTKAFCCRDRDPSEEFIAEFKTWLKEEAEERAWRTADLKTMCSCTKRTQDSRTARSESGTHTERRG